MIARSSVFTLIVLALLTFWIAVVWGARELLGLGS